MKFSGLPTDKLILSLSFMLLLLSPGKVFAFSSFPPTPTPDPSCFPLISGYVDDFEDFDLTNFECLPWSAIGDPNGSTVNPVANATGGANSTGQRLNVTGSLKTSQLEPSGEYSGFVSFLTYLGAGLQVENYNSLQFWIKTDAFCSPDPSCGAFEISIIFSHLDSFTSVIKFDSLDIRAGWAFVNIDLNSLIPNPANPVHSSFLAESGNMMAMAIKLIFLDPDPGATTPFDFSIDQVRFGPLLPSPTPTPPLTLTSTPTYTITPTFTVTPTPGLAIQLDQNFFDPTTSPLSIEGLSEANGRITINIFNLLGEKVRHVADWSAIEGTSYRYRWDGRNESGEFLGNGVYTIMMKSTKGVTLKKVIILK